MKRICVVGSLNVDFTIILPRFHAPGETISGSDFAVYTGGKGGNQAVALGRLGADVAMAGRIGDDENGSLYRRILRQERVRDDFVSVCDTPTGVALIEVDARTGDNRIALFSGANAQVDAAFIDRLWPALSAYDIFLMQFEIPMPTVLHAAEKIAGLGKTLIVDPAPAQPLPEALRRCAAYITPNETELALITGMPIGDQAQAQAAAQALCAQGARGVVAKLGAAGALLVTPEGAQHVPGFAVRAVDTTAAGDSFNAGFAFALAQGKSPLEATVFANAVGALSTTAMGAQAAMPSLDAALALMARTR
ncbi:MAG: ribokinase [Oscillospiraceae bacterium]|nr:ribokinase [Oscillospiraceae bacterium]